MASPRNLRGDVPAGGTQGPAQADLDAALQDGDEHDVHDPDGCDEQGDHAEGDQQVGERVVSRCPGGQRRPARDAEAAGRHSRPPLSVDPRAMSEMRC